MVYQKPVKKGDKYKVEIKRLTRRGDGYVRIKGFSIFVKNVDLGWSGEIEIKRVATTYAIATPT